MEDIRIAFLQIAPTGTTEGNRVKGELYCRKAKELGADIALFPEMWSSGYGIPEEVELLKALAVSKDGEFVSCYKALAEELNMAIGITILEDFEPVGSMICYDREFPESARILMLKGAEILLVPNACPMEINRISQLRGRAYENMVGIATVNYPEAQPDCNGHSTAFDGIAYRPQDSGSRDTLFMEADGSEGIFTADFPIDEIREYRSREVHGNAYRHPAKYKLLVSEEICEPFIRQDYRR